MQDITTLSVSSEPPPLAWSAAHSVEALRETRNILPLGPGVYLFSTYSTAVERDTGVLYIGKARSLRKRLSSYLVDPEALHLFSLRSGEQRMSRSLLHAGKNLLLMEIQQRARSGSPGLWVRWVVDPHPGVLERLLIDHYRPAFNTSLNPRTQF